MRLVKIFIVALPFLASGAHAQVIASSPFTPSASYSWPSPQTFTGGMTNATTATNVVGNIFNQTSTSNAPTTGDALFRPIFWDNILTIPSSGSSSGIHEHFFVETDSNWSGTFTQSGEYNLMHVFAKDIDTGCANATSCTRSGRLGGFEFSGTDDINITGSVTPFYDAYIINASGHVTTYNVLQAGLQNNGTVGEFAIVDFNGVSGAGTITSPYFMLNRTTTYPFVTLSPVNIGENTLSGGGQLYIKGTGTTNSTHPIFIKNSSNTITFNFGDDGSLTTTGTFIGGGIKNTSLGAGGASTANVTTFTAAGTVNINASNNAVTNIGTGTTNQAVTIGGASNTTTVASVVLNTGITADTGHTDSTVCQDTTTHQFYSGTGTLGVCLGTSSIRFKHDWREISDLGLRQIELLKPGTFFYKKGYGDGGAHQQIGFLAEDVDKVLPKLVGHDASGQPSSVDILGMVPVMVKAMQQQQAEIAELRQEIRTLRHHR